MIITSRKETFYKIEMTAAQADCLLRFFESISIQDVFSMESNRDEILLAINDFVDALSGR